MTGFLNTTSNPVAKAKPEKAAKADKSSNPPRLLSGPELAEFKRAVEGSDDTKVVLLGLLKKQYVEFTLCRVMPLLNQIRFLKTPNAVLSETLKAVAFRAKESKKWALL